MKDETRYMTEQATMAYLSASRFHVRNWCKQIGATRKLGNAVRYDKEVIDRVLAEQGEANDDKEKND